ncbi:hypothetical protein Lal_00007019 [Lupinus albus]|nr:hypothetical protein Lal_00007019 [Lupinus albus]
MLLVLVVAVVLAFKKSDNLAAAYGVAVTTTMVITTMLLGVVMRHIWKWRMPAVVVAIGCFMVVDVAFFAANLLKLTEGGWFPLVIGGAAFFLLMTWYSGRMLLRMRIKDDGIPIEPFIEGLLAHPPHRVGGTAVFMTGNIATVPVALLHNLKHNRILHERVFFLKISIWDRAPDHEGAGWRRLPAARGLRFQGSAGGAEGHDADRTAVRPSLRPDGHLLLPGARHGGAEQAAGHVAVARAPVCLDVPERGQAVGLLPHPGQPGGGAGHQGRDLSGADHGTQPGHAGDLHQTVGEEVRQALEILRDHLEQVIEVARDGVALDDFRKGLDHLFHRAHLLELRPVQRQRDEGRDIESDLGRCHQGGIAADHALLLQRTHAPHALRRREVDALGQVDVADLAVGLQQFQDLDVDLVHEIHRHEIIFRHHGKS